jgi:hypothetical protein
MATHSLFRLAETQSAVQDTKVPNSRANRTFHGADPTWANACVGDNGNPQITEYAEGFASAAKTLLDAVIAGEGLRLAVDIYIYPICFNVRHAVELFLKSTAQRLQVLASLQQKKIEAFDLLATHDLHKIWNHVRDSSSILDARYKSRLAPLEEYVRDIASIDATGQVFRYPFDSEQKKHLVEVSVINLLHLRRRFAEMEEMLLALSRLNVDLISEYRWGTFTSHLSRVQLIELARHLPPRARWREAEFDVAKAHLRNKYGLSSREFSKALDLIQSRHEMAPLIGARVEIPGLSESALQTYFDQWVRLHDIEKMKADENEGEVEFDHEVSPERVWAYHQLRAECCEVLVKTLTPESFAALRSLFYFDRESPYSEVFDLLQEEHRREAERYGRRPEDFMRDIGSLLVKTDGLESALNSLDFLGQGPFRDFLFDRYGLNPWRDLLLERSSRRKLFVDLDEPHTELSA